MKLQQLRYVWEVAHHNLNVSATAQSLYTSQPGISKQIRLLEDELGVEIFVRSGKHLTHITPVGNKIIEKAGEVLRVVECIKQVSQEFCSHDKGCIKLASTYLHAHFHLSNAFKTFSSKYPQVSIHYYQGDSSQVLSMVLNSYVDFAIISHDLDAKHNELLLIPCYHWQYSVIVPTNHPLTSLERKITIEDIKDYPIVTYAQNEHNRSHLDELFAKLNARPNIICSATDVEVIKNYVKYDFGIGIIAKMAYNSNNDKDLKILDSSQIFTCGTVYLCLRKGYFIREFMEFFLLLCANGLTQEQIKAAALCHDQEDINEFFENIRLPIL